MFDTDIENNTPQNVDQFMMVNQQIYIQNLVNDLTANRRLGNKRSKKTEQILLGYNKVFTLLAKFKV